MFLKTFTLNIGFPKQYNTRRCLIRGVIYANPTLLIILNGLLLQGNTVLVSFVQVKSSRGRMQENKSERDLIR